jgi:hypothetical protein
MSINERVKRAAEIIAQVEAKTLSVADARKGLLDLGEHPDLVEEMIAIALGGDDVVEEE